MRLFTLFLTVVGLSLSLSAQQVILTGVIDGTLSGGNPRGVEIYVQGTVDLSDYSVNRYANGATSAGGLSVTLSGTYTDEFVYLVFEQAAFANVFGTSGDFANVIVVGSTAQANGDDVYTIERNGTIVDQAGGVIGVDQDVYLDSWLYRNDGTGPDGDWVPANWSNVGQNNSLDSPNNTTTAIANLVPFGTYVPANAGPSVSVSAAGDLAEPGTGGGFTIALSEAAAGPVTVNYSLGGTATAGADYTDVTGGSVTIAAGALSASVSLTVTDDADSEPVETIVLTLTSVSDANYSLGGSATVEITDDEEAPVLLISSVQGAGDASPLLGQTVTVSGIVTGDFQGGTGVGLGGFYVQEEDADADADPATSEGLWVFDNNTGTAVSPGDLVTVTGEVSEFGSLTQLNVTGSGASVTVESSGNALPTVTPVDLPVGAASDFERREGMLIELTDDAVVTNTRNLFRFGEFTVAGERLAAQFTECNTSDPAGLAAFEAAQDLRLLVVDDGRSGSDVYPVVLPDGSTLDATTSLRGGARLVGLTGVLDERFNAYRIQPTDVDAINANGRPTTAPNVGGNLTVVAMNVLNYFTTFGSRGADNATELQRQEDKIVAAICELDADVIGLVEIENNGFGAGSAVDRLLTAINTACGIDYDVVIPPGNESGTDQIMVCLIYKPSVVEESGTAAVLTQPSNVFSRNRVPVAQTFRVIEPGNANLGQEVTVTVNHWKSKGGSCGSGDDDNGGAGSCNGSRTAAAQAIKAWLAGDPTGTGEPDQLVIGDLNAYSAEDPILTFTDDNWVNTVQAANPGGDFPCGGVPSYVFSGEWGSLDHVLASPSVAPSVTGATAWAVNAEEAEDYDYNTDEGNNPALYTSSFYRFSDHNPVVVGLDLGVVLPAELIAFAGRPEDGTVVLDWTTASESGTERFDVQRRTAGGGFTTLGSVTAAGNTTGETDYTFTDSEPFDGDNIYRLRIVDADGSVAVSGLVTVRVEGANSLQVYQTSPGYLRLFGAGRGSEYVVITAAGATVATGLTRGELTDVNSERLATGLYFLVVRTPGGQLRTLKVMVN